MELIVLIPVILLMGGVAIYIALNERPLPVLNAAHAMPAPSMPAGLRVVRPQPMIELALDNAPESVSRPADAAAERARPTFTPTDVLLADALTEMIGLKTELSRLRGRVDMLNNQVARLSGEPPTPPSAAKRPVHLRRVA